MKKKILKKTAIRFLSFLMIFSMLGTMIVPQNVEAVPEQNMCETDSDVVMVIDRSGSMSPRSYPLYEDRIGAAKTAADNFLDYFGVDDQSSLVSYSSNVVLENGLTSNHSLTQANVNNLPAFPTGLTNTGGAMATAIDELLDNGRDQAVKAIILLTDGHANVGPSPEDKADAAAAAGIIIYTIGLGSDVDTALLLYIANTTGGEYYHAPTPEDLEGIYETIRWQLCQLGSISGCKYETDIDHCNISPMADWEIVLSGDANSTQTTDVDGCYKFSGLSSGDYTISEAVDQGVDYIQTYPQAPSFYSVTLGNEENLTGYDFGNYLPTCGNGTCDYNEDCSSCSQDCGPCDPVYGPYCGDGIVQPELGEQCDSGHLIGNPLTTGCSDQCQYVTGECSEKVFARVMVTDVQNKQGTEGMTDYIFLGTGTLPIPSGAWFMMYDGSLYINDPDVNGYEDVPGLAVQRDNGSITVRHYGSHDSNSCAQEQEHVEGMIEFYNAGILDIANDDASGNNKMEGDDWNTTIPTSNTLITAGKDYAWIDGNKSHFWMTVTVADDSYFTTYVLPPVCEEDPTCSVSGYKYNHDTGLGMPSWNIGIAQIAECVVADEEWADSVVSYLPVGTIADERDDPDQALGVAERDDTVNFVSLGIGGELILEFDNLILNGAGDDIEVVETSFGDPTCQEYPEKVNIFASQNGTDWEDLGEGCLDSTFDLGSLPWAKYIKIQEVSVLGESGYNGDGYDVDAVRAIHCGNYEMISETQTEPDGSYCFSDVVAGDYAVYEEMQGGWDILKVMTGQTVLDYFADSFFDVFVEIDVVDRETTTVDFYNQEEDIPAENQPPVADAGADQTVTVGTTVNFDGSNSTDSDGTIVSYDWNFDDGNTAIGATTTHTYTATGTYSVVLTVTDDDNATDTDEAVITVEPVPTPDPFCGDGICNGNETCSSCPEDCDPCPDPTPPTPPTGGGGCMPPPAKFQVEPTCVVTHTDNGDTVEIVINGDTNLPTDFWIGCRTNGFSPNWGEAPSYDQEYYSSIYDEYPTNMTRQHSASLVLDANVGDYYCLALANEHFTGRLPVRAEVLCKVPEVKAAEAPVVPPVVEDKCDFIKGFAWPSSHPRSVENDPVEIAKWETMLNRHGDIPVAVDGIYSYTDVVAMKAWQAKYGEEVLVIWGLKADQPTGNGYITSRRIMNWLECGYKAPLTQEELAEIERVKRLNQGTSHQDSYPVKDSSEKAKNED